MAANETAAGVVSEWLSLFRRDPEARLRMQCARRAGISYQEAELRWGSLESLAAEAAWDHLEADASTRRCQSCGVDPDDMEDERGRPLKEPRWQVAGYSCLVCEQIHDLTEALSDQERKNRRYRIRSRSPGDPTVIP